MLAALALASSAFAVKEKHHNNLETRTGTLEREIANLKEQIKNMKDIKAEQGLNTKAFVEPYAHGSAVVTSPLIGIRDAYDASDLMVNLPSANEDLMFLLERQKVIHYTDANSIDIPRRPVIALSGAVEGKVVYNHDYNATGLMDVDLSRAEIDVVGEINPWITTAILVTYDSSKLPDSSRVTNSGLQVNNGFITLGNLDKVPLYFTIGQIFLPFGDYSNFMVTTPLTSMLGKTKQRAAVLGFFKEGFNASVYTFQGDTHVSDSVDTLKRGGANLSYTFKRNDVKVGFGVGYIGNLAESQGMQTTYLPVDQFPGFSNNENMFKRAPAINIHGRCEIGKPGNQFDFLAEFVGASRHFDVSDLTFNSQGAKPTALDLEGQYEFLAWTKPASISIGYGRTWQALALNLPEHDYFVALHTSIWKDTIESLEYRRDVNYSSSDYATGGVHNGSTVIKPVGSRHRNVVTAQFGVYF